MNMPVTVSSTQSGGLAQRHGIEVGDKIVAINGNEINDILDYRFYETDRRLLILLEKSDGGRREITVRKGQYDSLGVECGTYLMDRQRSCRNKCVFCFIDQLPKGMRKSLYFKDDDDRLSFLFGNYITLTNIDEREIERIIKMRISPVNISVHTTNPELRVRMMKNPRAGEALRFIGMLARGGISLNCQIVLCPEWNDGEELDRTLRDLTELCPAVQSIAVVPVGLTRHREGLEKLRMFSAEECGNVIDQIEKLILDNAHHAKAQDDYANKFRELNDAIESKRSDIDSIKYQISDALARRENAKIFIEGLKNQKSYVEEFDVSGWHALVDYISQM